MEQLDDLLKKHTEVLSGSQCHRLTTITKLKEQQWQLHLGKQATVPDRIVSLHKSYVRPIVRGKEVKPVEFGAKVNMLLVDGISFIEHLSYDNFNEGTRLQRAIHLQERYFGACHQMGADAIYGTNDNRTYCTKNNIATSFVPKGNEGKLKEQKSQMRSILGKIRSTVLEGSFGNEKNHYQMNKIKAKTEGNEKGMDILQPDYLQCHADSQTDDGFIKSKESGAIKTNSIKSNQQKIIGAVCPVVNKTKENRMKK